MKKTWKIALLSLLVTLAFGFAQESGEAGGAMTDSTMMMSMTFADADTDGNGTLNEAEFSGMQISMINMMNDSDMMDGGTGGSESGGN